MKTSWKLLCCSLLFVSHFSFAQHRQKAQEIIEELCHKKMAGRGYTNKGHLKAAEYIAEAFEEKGVQAFDQNYFQEFSLSVNTFPGDMELEAGDVDMVPGKDFIPMAPTRSFEGEYKVRYVGRNQLQNPKTYTALQNLSKDEILYLDTLQNPPEVLKEKRGQLLQLRSVFPVIEAVEKLTMAQSREQNCYGIQVIPGKIQRSTPMVEVEIEAEFKPGIKSQNVIGYIPGTIIPDSFVVITAHYDHLGNIGKKTYIPGANDNASGIAMMLDLCDYFYRNAPSYSVLFIAFGGEEAGLVGSHYYTENPDHYVSLSNMCFLINVDLMGSGQEGIMAVNGRVFKEEYNKLVSINEENQYLSQVKARGKAANSDHYFFTQKGVPAFFFYLMGPYQHYHDIYDNAENLTLTEHYDQAFRLIRDFAKSFWLKEP